MVIKGHGYSKSTFGANNIFGGFGGHPPPPLREKSAKQYLKPSLTAPKVFAKKQLPKKDNPSTSDKVKWKWLIWFP